VLFPNQQVGRDREQIIRVIGTKGPKFYKRPFERGLKIKRLL